VYDEPIAEYVLGLILSLAKDFPRTWEHQQHRAWRPHQSETITVRTALVWGTGPIDRAIARLLTAAGMRVCGTGRKARPDDPDFGTVHGPATLHRAWRAGPRVRGKHSSSCSWTTSPATSKAGRSATSSTKAADTWWTPTQHVCEGGTFPGKH
jgi:hypothetical protein